MIFNNFQYLRCIGVGMPCNVLQTRVVSGKLHMQRQVLYQLNYVGRFCANDVYGRWYAKCGRWTGVLSDVIAAMNKQMWQMEYHCGRCYGHIVV